MTTFNYRSEQIDQDISELKATVIAAASLSWRLCSTSSGDGLPYGNGRRLWTLMTGRRVQRRHGSSSSTADVLSTAVAASTGERPMRLVLCDRNRILCEALAATLQARCHQVLAIATSATGCIAAVAAHRPDACLLGPRFADESCLEAAQVIRPTDHAIVSEAKKIGVGRYLCKDSRQPNGRTKMNVATRLACRGKGTQRW
jgi:hypothetical protein